MQLIREVLTLLKREPALTGLAVLAFTLAGVILVVAATLGAWAVPPEGRLLDAFKFEMGVGIYFLTLALLLPLAEMSQRARKWWIGWTVGIGVYFIPIETIQAIRGLDPRFTRVGGVPDQVAGAVFGITAVIVVVLFAILGRRFFRNDVIVDHVPLRLAIRYGIAAITFAFGTGLVMSVLSSRFISETGNLMPLHAAGFHGIQAVPLVALFASAAGADMATRLRLTHIAGLSWLALCVSLLAQALTGVSVQELTPPGLAAAVAFLAWGLCVLIAGSRYIAAARAGVQID